MSDSSESKLDKLPDDILKIIVFFTEGEDDGNIRLVCRKFKNIFDETIGLCWGIYRRIVNNTEIEKFDELPSCRGFYLLTKFNSQKITVSLPIFKRKHLLQYIYLNTVVTKSSLNHTLAGLSSLETLRFYHWGLNNLTGIYIKDLVNLKHLQFLVSALYSDSESLYFVLINFLKIAEFPSLKELCVYIEKPNCENIFCDALLTFLIQHKKSMSELKLILWKMTQGEDWPALPDFQNRLTQVENHKLVKVRFCNRYLVNLTKLAEIFDKIITTGNLIEEANECGYYCWGEEDDHIIKFYCENQYAPLKRIPMQMIQNNCSTLVTIGLNIMPEHCRPLDCSIFVPCTSLRKLQLFTRLNSDAELTNATVLPRSLEIFEILHFQMKSEEIHSIATNNINLEWVYFGHTGTENGYGVKLESFTCFTARRTENIIIINSWNSADVNESLHNRGPFHRMQALALLETNRILFKEKYYSAFNREFRVKRTYAKVLAQPMKLVELGIRIADTDSGKYIYFNN